MRIPEHDRSFAVVMGAILATLLLAALMGCTDSPTAPPAVEQVDGTIVETCDGLLRNITECN